MNNDVQELEQLEEEVREFEKLINHFTKRFQRVCDEWNDVELALTDLNHFQELSQFNENGDNFIHQKRLELLKERRLLKKQRQLLLPYISEIFKIHKTIQELKEEEQENPKVYGIRSIRGYNIFSELIHHTKIEGIQNDYFDFTENNTYINHIYKYYPETENNPYIEKGKSLVEKQDQLKLPVFRAPNSAIYDFESDTFIFGKEEKEEDDETSHYSFADWEKIQEEKKPITEETEWERKIRLNKELKRALKVGKRYGKNML